MVKIINNKRIITLVRITIIPLVVIPLLIFSSYFTYLKVNDYNDSRDQLARATLNGLASIFENVNTSITEVLLTYSEFGAFRKMELTDKDREDIRALVYAYSGHSTLQDIAFGTVNGEMFTPNEPYLPADYDPRFRPWYMEASRLSGQVVLSPPYRDARDPSNWTLSYALQVTNDQGMPTGVLGTDLKLKGIEEYFNQYFSAFDGRIVVLDANSNIVIEKEDGIFSLSNKKGIAFEFVGSDGINHDVVYESINYRMDKATVESMGWCIVLLTPKDVIFNDMVKLLLPLFVVLIIVLVFIQWLFRQTRRTIIGPLEEFSQQFEGISIDGDYESIDFKESIPMEFHVIQDTVNDMLKRISHQTLVLQEQKEEINGQYEEINALYEETTAMNDSLNDLVNELQESYRATIYALSSAIEANDAYTKGHCDRVKEYAIKLGDAWGLSESELITLEYAAILHDVGKVGIPSVILNKPVKLSEEEYKIVQGHPTIGGQILNEIPYLKLVAKIVEQHHEWANGQGYPYGLKENEIHDYAQILCITDAYDAMTSERPYRKNAMTMDEAIDELKASSGTQFSQRKVETFIKILQNEKKRSE